MPTSRKQYIEPEPADASRARSLGHQAKSFAAKQERSRHLVIDQTLEIEECAPKAEQALEARDRGLDETLTDTFPCSDALSSIPNPAVEHRIRA